MTPREQAAKEYFGSVGIDKPTPKSIDRFNRIYDDGHADGVMQGIDSVRYNLGITVDSQVLVSEPGYEKLVYVLRDAHNQAAHGKGKQRHANDLPFHEQRMLSIARLLKSPPDALAFQVCKKVAEGLQMEQHERKVAELLGAINYIAGIVILLGEQPVPGNNGMFGETSTPDQADATTKRSAQLDQLVGAKSIRQNGLFEITVSIEDGREITGDLQQTMIDKLALLIASKSAASKPDQTEPTIPPKAVLSSCEMAIQMTAGLDQKDFFVGELQDRVQRALEDLRKNQPLNKR